MSWKRKSSFRSKRQFVCKVCFEQIGIGSVVAVHGEFGVGTVHLRCLGDMPDPEVEQAYSLCTYRSARDKSPGERTREESRIYKEWGAGWMWNG